MAPVLTKKASVQKEFKPTEYSSALRVLEGTFVRVEKDDDGVVWIAYANPSVRDFAIAFLNEEPDYLIAIIGDAIHLAQVSTLLVYAASKVRGNLRFQHCSESVTRHQTFITKRMMDLIVEEEVVGSSDRHEQFRAYDRAIKPLINSLEPALLLMGNSFEEILGVTTVLLEDAASGYMEADDWKLFNQALIITHCTKESDQIRDELRWAFESWGESLYSLAEVEDFEEYFHACGSVLKQHFDLSEKFHESISSGLRHELDTISYNRQDRETDHSWVDEVENAATRVGAIEDLRSEIESARESIEQHYSEDDLHPSQPASEADYGFPRDAVSASDRVAIDGMFRELS